MKRWFADTLAKRLFLLMWLALVVSHVVAFLVVTTGPAPRGEPPGSMSAAPPMPTFPSLPPTPGLSGAEQDLGPSPRPPMESDRPDRDRFGPPRAVPGSSSPGLPADALLLDYAVRLAIIALAAWWGARWLSAPVKRLVMASSSLATSLGDAHRPAPLDDAQGTVEVREAARVFNTMAGQLHQQFTSRGLFVAAISHDLRTPLTRMRIRLESLREHTAAERCIEDIHEMDALIDTILDVFSGVDRKVAAQATDVHSLVQSLVDDFVEQGKQARFDGESAIALAEPRSLRRIVSNLLDNALRYGEGVTVSVRSSISEVHVVIDDTGPGIPEDRLEQVFEPFYRLESSRNRHTGGAGLGLYIARDLTMRLGGSLKLTNRAESGLRVKLTLPRGP